MYDCSMEKYVYQMFILGLQNVDNALKKGLGGVIFFSKDIKDEESLKKKISEIKSNDTFPPPFISIDQEGGRVERTEAIRPKRLPARAAFEKGFEYLRKQSEEISKELSEWGFNLNFAPCIDVNTNPKNPIIGERAFSDNSEDVIKGYDIYVQALRKYGIPFELHIYEKGNHGGALDQGHPWVAEALRWIETL